MPGAWRELRFLRAYQGIGLGIVAAILYLSLTFHPPQGPDIPNADKWEHLLAYGSLMTWWGQLALSRECRARFVVAFVLMGGAVELLQGLGGVRHAEWGDFFANSLGVALGFWLTLGRAGRVLQTLEQRFLTQ